MTGEPVDAGEHRALARWVARKFYARDPDAVESAALLGVVKAARRYDPARGAFSSLAVLACRHEAFREVLRQRKHDDRETSLFVQGEDGDELERSDLPHVDPTAEGDTRANELRVALAGLEAREREILVRRFGLDGPEETLEEIGARLGLSRARVGQLCGRALGKLRRVLSRRRGR